MRAPRQMSNSLRMFSCCANCDFLGTECADKNVSLVMLFSQILAAIWCFIAGLKFQRQSLCQSTIKWFEGRKEVVSTGGAQKNRDKLCTPNLVFAG